MLKVRVIPTILFKDFGLVKGVGFDSWRRTGSALQAIRIYNMRGVDELVFFDISATPNGQPPDFQQIDDLADECFMPMTVGGGVRKIEDVAGLLEVGADRVAINTGAIQTPELVRESSQAFGSQCIVAAIDVRRHEDEHCEVYARCGQQPTGRGPVEWARELEALGAGEIILTSIERDGSMNGYDVALTRAVSDAVRIPVVASGGCGDYNHMVQVLREGGAAAVAAASIYHFTERTPREAKLHLRDQGIPVRL